MLLPKQTLVRRSTNVHLRCNGIRDFRNQLHNADIRLHARDQRWRHWNDSSSVTTGRSCRLVVGLLAVGSVGLRPDLACCRCKIQSANKIGRNYPMTDRSKNFLLPTGIALLCIACISCSSTPPSAPFNTTFWGGDDPNVIACSEAIFYPRNELGMLWTCQYLEHEAENRKALHRVGGSASGPQDLSSHFSPIFHAERDKQNPFIRSARSRFTFGFRMPNASV